MTKSTNDFISSDVKAIVMTNQAVTDLITRSNRCGADPRNTNYAGGNTSAKGTGTDPVTGEQIELCWVKGSGGDLSQTTGLHIPVDSGVAAAFPR